MKVELKDITRGRGSLYARIVLSDEADAPFTNEAYAAVVLSAASPEGAALPCELYCLDGIEGAVLRLALFPFAQTVTFYAESAADEITQSTTKARAAITLDSTKAKWQSRKNTLLKNHNALAIRDSECQRVGAPRMVITQGYVSQQGKAQYRVELSYQTTDEQKAHAHLLLTLINKHAQRLDDTHIIMLGDSVSAHPRTPTLLQRTVTFAVKLPQGEDFAVVDISSDVSDVSDAPDVSGASDTPDAPDASGVPDAPDTSNAPRFKTFFVLEEGAEKKAKDTTDFFARSAERDPRYEHWFKNTHRVSAEEARAQRLVEWAAPVTFSVIAVGYDDADALWDEALRSVLAQTYVHFELIVMCAGSGVPAADITADSRVQVRTLDASEDGRRVGDADLMNAGIAAAQGEFVCFLRACDRLEPDFLYCFARGLDECESAPLLYGDEGKRFEGHYTSPFFKPDWNPDLLTSFNYIGRVFAVRLTLLRELGALQSVHDGAQEYRIALAAGRSEVAPYHVARIISQRVLPKAHEDKLYDIEPIAEQAATAVLCEHCEQLSQPAQVQPGVAPGTFDVRYDIEDEPLVSIVIATKDHVPLLKMCIDSILEKSTYQNFEIIIVENNSTEPATFAYYDELVAADTRIKVHTCETGGKFDVSAVYNQGAAVAAGAYVILLNNDIKVIAPDWIERLLGPCQREDVGAVGAKLLYPDGVIQHAGAFMRRSLPHLLAFEGPTHFGCGVALDDCPYYYNLYNVKQDLSVCTGACLMTKKALYEEMGGFSLDFPTDYDDADYCLRLRKRGLQVVYEPFAKLYHHESASRGRAMTSQSRLDFSSVSGVLIARYPEYWTGGDPCVSPFLFYNGRGSHFE